MVNESATFGLSLFVTIVGLVIMLYGVSLNAGQSLNTMMIVGGVVVLAAITIHTTALMGMDSSHSAE